MATALAPPPLQTPVVETATSLLTRVWNQWLLSLTTRIQTSPYVLDDVTLSTQNASIGTTNFNVAGLNAGLYSVMAYARITRAATVNSSLIVKVGHTDAVIPCVQSAGAITSNDVAAPESRVFALQCDQNTPISYSTTYASTGATSMRYTLRLALLLVDA